MQDELIQAMLRDDQAQAAHITALEARVKELEVQAGAHYKHIAALYDQVKELLGHISLLYAGGQMVNQLRDSGVGRRLE